MKHYYRIADFVIQAGILLSWLASCLVKAGFAFDFYFITGAWFLVSLIIHRFISSQKYKDTYKAFCAAVGIIAGVFCIGLMLPVIMILELYALLFASPVLALVYTLNCFSEIRYLNKRPISYLK